MGQTCEGASHLFDDNGMVNLPALNYALVKMEMATTPPRSIIHRTAALAFYLHHLNRERLHYTEMAQQLRNHTIYTNYGTVKENDFWNIEEFVTQLYENKLDGEDKQALLTKEGKGAEWERHITCNNPQEFMQAIYPPYADKNSDRYFKYVVEHYQANCQGQAFDEDCAAEAVQEVLQGEMKNERGLHYFGLMAYQSRHKTVALDADIDDIRMFVKARDLEIEAKKREKERVEKQDARHENGCMGAFVLGAVVTLSAIAYQCDKRDKKEQELKQTSKEIVLPDVPEQDAVMAKDTVQFVNEVMKNTALKPAR